MSDTMPRDTVSFTEMKFGTAKDYALLDRHEDDYVASLAPRVLSHLELQAGGFGGYQIDRLQHSLQTATRAERDGASDEWIFAALLHDIGDTIAPVNHSEMAAAVIKPYVTREIYDVIRHHGVFQGYYYFHHSGGDREARQAFKDEPFFEATVDFCERWDQNSFDPNYKSHPLEHFAPLVHEIFSRKPDFQTLT